MVSTAEVSLFYTCTYLIDVRGARQDLIFLFDKKRLPAFKNAFLISYSSYHLLSSANIQAKALDFTMDRSNFAYNLFRKLFDVGEHAIHEPYLIVRHKNAKTSPQARKDEKPKEPLDSRATTREASVSQWNGKPSATAWKSWETTWMTFKPS
ncbi:hypothetical protein CTA2_6552 [Colletotrichum tanaceti]|uniref:Uncharacterized protein n=1 Tax=Colletotrichum tanaceti TaxID=1306861 RepID=A0A4U6X345_9PEZI|nr:hypothetical protein CTA2_6552 [Colletotrichum tanaceti]TKW49798.1 hypothetical protein CTA1_4395 [Colletotrichum tanaceti]